MPDNAFLDQALEPSLGAFHTSELYYSFRNLSVREWPWSEADRAMAETVSAYWLAFMRFGDPNNSGCPTWPAFKGTDPAMMVFDGPKTGSAKAPSAALAQRLEFWDDVYSKARRETLIDTDRQAGVES